SSESLVGSRRRSKGSSSPHQESHTVKLALAYPIRPAQNRIAYQQLPSQRDCGFSSMTTIRFLIVTLWGLAIAVCASAQQPASPKPNEKLPLTGLSPAQPHPGLCQLSYRISTASPECQAFFDQGLAFYYSYVYMEAARSFETATRYDPKCAIAYWGLSRAQDNPYSRGDANVSLKKAQELLPYASDRGRLLITAR